MNKCLFQLWEESERGWGIRPDGCSIHLDQSEFKKYISKIYDSRTDDVPYEYDRVVGKIIDCFISDTLFDKLKESGSIRLLENEKNNLISMQEIIFKEHEIF
jgi:hypothetical protein